MTEPTSVTILQPTGIADLDAIFAIRLILDPLGHDTRDSVIRFVADTYGVKPLGPLTYMLLDALLPPKSEP